MQAQDKSAPWFQSGSKTEVLFQDLKCVLVERRAVHVCTAVCMELRLGWESLVVELAGSGRGPRLRVPPPTHLPRPTTPHYPHQPLASLRHRRGVYLSPTSTSPQHAPRSSWTVGKTKIGPVLPFYPVVGICSSPFLKDTTQSQLMIFQHHSLISTSSSSLTDPFNPQTALPNILTPASTNICTTHSP